jgi:hypothetical protein
MRSRRPHIAAVGFVVCGEEAGDPSRVSLRDGAATLPSSDARDPDTELCGKLAPR